MANEKRLIAYDPITFESFKRHSTKFREPAGSTYDMGYMDAFDNIEDWLDFNTVDAVPVVRCKDCKCSKPTAWYSAKLKCCHPSHMNSQVPHEVLPDHFCSYGERRTE